jgi:chromosome segregation ATPase
LESQLLLANSDRERLKQEADRRTDELDQRNAKILGDERDRYSRLENEFNMLQREASRNEVLNKGLQRDVQRLQSSFTTSEEALAKSQIQTEELHQQLRMASEHSLSQSEAIVTQAKRVEDLETQNSILLTQLDELRSQIEDLKSRTANNNNHNADTGGVTVVVNTEVQTDDAISHLDIASIDTINDRSGAEVLLRQEMDFLRSLPSSQYRTVRTPPSSTTTQSNMGMGSAGREDDMYTAHLNKLLQLAEAAINRSS